MYTGSRREFLNKMYSATAIGILNPFRLLANNEVDPRIASIVASTIGVDAHNHIDVPNVQDEIPGPDIELSGELKRSGLSAICMTFAVDYQKMNDPSEGYKRFMNSLNSMDQQLTKNGLKRALNLADIKQAHDNKQPIVIQSVEGGHFLEGKVERVEEAFSKGLRQLGLLHDNDASVPLGDLYTKEPQFGGLTPFGADVIRECNRLGILVDLTHASSDTVSAALKISKHPMIFSHTSLDTRLGNDTSMAAMMKPRLISSSAAKAIADQGGVVGVWRHLTNSAMEYVANVRAMIEVVGIEHVCIGTDTKLTPAYRRGGNQNQDQGKRFGERTNEIWPDQTNGFYYAVVEAMLKAGFNEKEISKIGGDNFCRVFDAATSIRH